MPVPQQPQKPQTPQPAPPQTPPQEPPATPTTEDVLHAAGVDGKTIQILMALMSAQGKNFMDGIAELRKPSPEQTAKDEAAKNRLLQARKNAAAEGDRVTATIKSEQTRCQHRKPNGEHTFRGQVHSDGWAQVICQRCVIRFRVKPLPEHIANGLNLDQVPGLSVEHLQNWAKQSARIDRELNAAAVRQARLSEIRLDTATDGAPITGL